jgi:hypothetical protein
MPPARRPETATPAWGGRCIVWLGPWILPRVVRVDPCNSRNIRAADADIGQFAVAEMRKLVHGGAVAPPSVKTAGNGFQHDSFPGNSQPESQVEDTVTCALHHRSCCSAARNRTHGLAAKTCTHAQYVEFLNESFTPAAAVPPPEHWVAPPYSEPATPALRHGGIASPPHCTPLIRAVLRTSGT